MKTEKHKWWKRADYSVDFTDTEWSYVVLWRLLVLLDIQAADGSLMYEDVKQSIKRVRNDS